MRGHARFLAVTLMLGVIGCSEAPKPVPPAPAPAPQPIAETPPPAEPPQVIPIEPPLLERRGLTEPTIKKLDSPQPAEPATPPAPSSARALGNAVRRALGIPTSSASPDPLPESSVRPVKENERPQ